VDTGWRLLRDDAVFDLDLRAGRHRLYLGDGEPLADLGHAQRGDLVVELAEHLAGDRMHDRDLALIVGGLMLLQNKFGTKRIR
jgi:hypothetical protein